MRKKTREPVKDRLVATAYDLFVKDGIGAVGIDKVLEKSGSAKASLYTHFKSKSDLALATLARRETLWTRGWLEQEILQRAAAPAGRLLAIFDVFDEWFQRADFEGCYFVNVMLEFRGRDRERRAAVSHLAVIRGIVRDLAAAEHLSKPEQFSAIWHILMKGSIVAAGEGNRQAAADAKRAARLVLDGWPRDAVARRH
jgi:AcrR family transcriptional regulator